MPFATIETNIAEADIPQKLCENLTKWLAKTLEKPEGRISVTLLPGRHMMRGGSNAPLLHMELAAVGVISDGKQTGPLTEQLFAFLQELTGLTQDRITVVYKPIQPWQVGLNGATLGMEDCVDSKHLLRGPARGYCIPEFVTKSEEEYLLKQVYNAPTPKWTQLSHRRLQNWGGIPHPNGMIAEPIPPWLRTYLDKLGNLGIFKDKLPNHVLVNEYKAGEGIMPHLDGPLFYPTIATISLGSHAFLDFSPVNQDGSCQNVQKAFSVYVPPRSLLVLQENFYHDFMHGIKERPCDMMTEEVVNFSPELLGQEMARHTRVSLTIRHVPKTSKMKIKLGR